MIDLDEYIDDKLEKISKIPDIDKESIEDLLALLPSVGELGVRQMMREIDSMVEPAWQEHKLNSKNLPLLPIPDNEKMSRGMIDIGMIYSGGTPMFPCLLDIEDIREGMLVIARSGGGKTRFVYHLAKSFVDLDLNFVCWDIKDDYAGLVSLSDDINMISWNDLRFNPITNIPKNMDVKMWHRKLFEITSHNFSLLMATPSYLLERLTDLLDEKDGLVTFKDLGDSLMTVREDSRKRDEYLSVAENRINLLNHALGDVINCRYGFDISEIFSQKIVIRLRGLETKISGWLIQTMMAHEFYSRMFGQVRL